jgi:hypothetical protein
MLDPFPFRGRDLSPEAEQYIVDRAEDLPKDRPITIIAHLQEGANDQPGVQELPQAIAAWFAERATDETRNMQTLFRDGRWALLIGLTVLGLCLAAAWWLSLHLDGPGGSIIRESLVIVGWVVIWRPAEMFLYDWVPIVRRRSLFRRLAAATVIVKHDLPAAARAS